MSRILVTAALLGAMTTGVLAQSASPQPSSSQLTLRSALSEADARNPEIAAARDAVGVADAVLTQTAPTPLQARIAPGVTQDVPNGLGTLQTFSASVSQELSPTLGAQRRAARAGIDVALAQLAGVRRSVDQRVVVAYYALASSQAIVAAARQSVDNATQIESSAALRAKVGDVGSFEVLRARVELRRAQADLLRAQGSERTAQIALDVLLAQSTETRNEVVLPTGVPSVPDTKALYARAQRLDPQLAEFRASIDRAIAQRHAAALQWAPSIGLAGGYLFQRVPGAPGILSRGGTASVTLSLPVFDYGTIRGAVREAQAQKAVAEARLRGRDAQLHADIEQTVSDIESAKARFEFARVSLEQAREALRLAQFGYARGALGVLDILSARNEFAATQSEVTQASADLGASLARLQLIVGEPVSL